MIPLYTTSQIRAIDQNAINSGVPSAILMENAAVNIARVISERAYHK